MITIGRLSKMTGVSARSIRHYEKIGLLNCTANTFSNYRLYDEKEIKKLQQIILLRSLGLSLNEILEIMTADENAEIAEIFEKRLNILNKDISRLEKSKVLLEAVTNIYQTQGLEYINNFYLMEEMLYMSTKFSKIFNRLELGLQIKILKELYKTGTLLPETLREIGSESGQVLLKEIHMVMIKALLNKSNSEVEKNIMMTLEKEDIEFRNEIMKGLFTFDDIAKLPDETIKKWLTKCEDNELSIALKDSGNYLKNKVFNNMSCERSDRLKKSIENIDAVSLDQEFVAMNNLIDLLRKMEANGEIVIDRFE